MKQCEDLIKQFEGLYLKPYLCPSLFWTVGYGHCITKDGQMLKGASQKALALSIFPSGITEKEADNLLNIDINNFTNKVKSVIKVSVTNNQLSALISFAFNVGIGNLTSSTLLRKLNTGDYDCVPTELMQWVHITKNGKKIKLAGLVNRRKAEAKLWSDLNVE